MFPSESALFEKILSAGSLPVSEIPEADADALNGLLYQSYVKLETRAAGNRVDDWFRVCVPTDAGRHALQLFKDQRQRDAYKKADEERNRLELKAEAARNRRNNLACGIIGGVVGSLCTYVLTHGTEIVKRILRMFMK